MVIIDLVNTCLAPVTVIQLLHIFLLFVQCNYYQIKEIHPFFFFCMQSFLPYLSSASEANSLFLLVCLSSVTG